MRHLSLVLGFACPPAGSPLIHPPHLLPCSTLSSSRSHRHRQPCHLDASRHAELGPSMGSALTRPATTRSRAFLSNEAVSYYHNPDTGSEIWLVGVIHDARASSRRVNLPGVAKQLVEKVIRKIKPKVVMVEVDAYRIRLLPPGEATQDQDGLCWWSPLQERPEMPQTRHDGEAALQDGGREKTETKVTSVSMEQGLGVEAMVKKSLRRKRQSKKEESGYEETEGNTCEFNTAAKEAAACGARVLLGDRDFEETERRLQEAERADKEDVASPGRRKSGEKKMVEARIKRRGLEATTPALWRKMRDLEKSWKPRKFAILMTERDEVMAKNLMMLRGNQATVAIVGAHHMVGIGGILATSGWKTRRK